MDPFFSDRRRVSFAFTGILLISFLGRVGIRLFCLRGEDYWSTGYSFFGDAGRNIAQLGQLSVQMYDMTWSALRPPVYPLIIAATYRLFDGSALLFILLQAGWATATIYIVSLLAEKEGGPKAGLFAACLAGVFPYTLMHDTALQETSLFSFFCALSVYLLVLGEENDRWRDRFLAGSVMGLAALTRSSFQLFAMAFLFVLIWQRSKYQKPWFKQAGWILVGMLTVMSPWLIRNYLLLGIPTISTETGVHWAIAHNPHTLDDFPSKTIDLVPGRMEESFTVAEKDALNRARGDELAFASAHAAIGWRWIKSHPGRAFAEGLYKGAVSFTGIRSPWADLSTGIVYFLSYWVLTVLAFVSLWTPARSSFRLLFLTLNGAHFFTAFLFWSHTSHRAFLDPLLAAAAGVGLVHLLSIYARKEKRQPHIPYL